MYSMHLSDICNFIYLSLSVQTYEIMIALFIFITMSFMHRMYSQMSKILIRILSITHLFITVLFLTVKSVVSLSNVAIFQIPTTFQ